MSNVFFISDTHFYHQNILNFSGNLRDGDNVEEHNQILLVKWNSNVTKRDLVYLCGDACMGKDPSILGELNGRKILIRGNHDNFPLDVYLKYFEDIQGVCKYKGYWVSHAPIHPDELRGKSNIHGHVHSQSIKNQYGEYDKRYINVCCEAIDGYPIRFDRIKDGTYWDIKKT